MTDVNERSRIFREMCLKADTERDKGLTTPEDIKRFDDIPYGADEKWQILDVYRPKSHEGEKLPVIVSIHGGGWVYGSKEIACTKKGVPIYTAMITNTLHIQVSMVALKKPLRTLEYFPAP